MGHQMRYYGKPNSRKCWLICKARFLPIYSSSNQQAEALNIPPSEYSIPPLSDPSTRTKTLRGGTRGRGTYPPRGATRGRGARGGSSRSLDLRPRSILVPGVVGTEKETSVREWVIMNYADAICEVSTDDDKGMIVKFRERYEAEEVLP
jgi:hypothetical protein